MSDLRITGTVRDILPEQSGESRNGPWRKQDFILETEGEYPKKICCTVWGDHVDQFGLVAGETLEVAVDIQSREYNGRWYTDVKAWKVVRQGAPPRGPVQDDPLPEHAAPTELTAPDDLLPF